MTSSIFIRNNASIVRVSDGAVGGAPSLVSIVIADATPTQMTLTYDQALDAASVPATTRFWCNSQGWQKFCTNVNVTGQTVVLTWGESFQFEEWAYLFYIVPTSSMIRAAGAGTAVADILGTTATNNIAAAGTVYYVDPATGNDANAGTSQGSPWQTIPGTRVTADSGFLRSTWGSIDGTPTVAAGSRIRIKAGRGLDDVVRSGGRFRCASNVSRSGEWSIAGAGLGARRLPTRSLVGAACCV